VLNEAREDDRAEKTVKDQAKIGELLAYFPEIGTDKEPNANLPGGARRSSAAAYFITFTRKDGEPYHLIINSRREFWCWSKGKQVTNGEWHLKNPKEVSKFLDELLK
jgi:hypothetical protein